MVRLTDRPDMTLGVYRGRKTTTQPQQQQYPESVSFILSRREETLIRLIGPCLFAPLLFIFNQTNILLHFNYVTTIINIVGQCFKQPMSSCSGQKVNALYSQSGTDCAFKFSCLGFSVNPIVFWDILSFLLHLYQILKITAIPLKRP